MEIREVREEADEAHQCPRHAGAHHADQRCHGAQGDESRIRREVAEPVFGRDVSSHDVFGNVIVIERARTLPRFRPRRPVSGQRVASRNATSCTRRVYDSWHVVCPLPPCPRRTLQGIRAPPTTKEIALCLACLEAAPASRVWDRLPCSSHSSSQLATTAPVDPDRPRRSNSPEKSPCPICKLSSPAPRASR